MALKLRRGLYANIVSTAGVVLALGGTAYASTLVTSAQIQDGTIKNRDVHPETIDGSRLRDGSIRGNDLSPSARSAVYSIYHDDPIALTDYGFRPVMSLTIPRAGDYYISAKTVVDSASGLVATWCELDLGADRDDAWGYAQPGQLSTLSMQIVHQGVPAGGTVSLDCAATSSPGFPQFRATKITAVSVDSVTNVAG